MLNSVKISKVNVLTAGVKLKTGLRVGLHLKSIPATHFEDFLLILFGTSFKS